MADQIPLRIVYVSGVPTIGEFQSGDTIASSIAAGGGAGGSASLSGLNDVTFTDLAEKQHIMYDGAAWVNTYNDFIQMQVRNGTGSTLNKGDAVHVTGPHGADQFDVELADASDASKMPAIGILDQNLAPGATGIVITFGQAQGLVTSGLTEGATAYVSPTTPGAITDVKPTDAAHLIQNIGIVVKAHATNGFVKVTGVGRANDVDNVTRLNLSSVYETVFDFSSTWTGGTGITDHGLLTGLSDNDHPQYVLSSTNNALSSLVSNVETSTVNLSGYISANEAAWSTDNDTTDHTALSNIGTNTHAQIDSHIADSTLHFTEGSIDHGSIAGLGDNDHPQYLLSSTYSAASGNWESAYGTVNSLSASWEESADITYVSGVVAQNVIDIGTNATDIGSNTTLIGANTADITNLGSVSANIATNTSNITANDNDITYVSGVVDTNASNHSSHTGDATIHFTEGSIDHGSIAGLGDNDHPQYLLSSTYATTSGVDETVDYDFSSTEFHVHSGTVNINWSGTNGPTGSSRRGKLNVRQDDTTKPTMTLYTADDGADAAPILEMKRDSSTAANNDYIGQIKWCANSDTGANRIYGKITGKIDESANGAEGGLLEFMTRQGGGELIMARFKDNTFRTLNGVEIWSDGDIEISTSSVSSVMDNVNNNSANWTSTYQTVTDNSGTWGGGGGVTDHGALTGLADDDHTQYARVDGTRPLNTQDIHDTYSGTVGDTSIGYGLETAGNLVNKAGNYVMFSATAGYQFRKDGLTAYTSTDLPDTMRNWDSAYNQLNTSFYPSFIQLTEAGGGQNINNASKTYVHYDTVDASGGAASTDFTFNGSDTLTVNTAGTYEISVNVGVESGGTGTSNQRTATIIRCEKAGTDFGPSAKTGYIRITASHTEASHNIATFVTTFTASQTLKIGSVRETTQTGAVNTSAGECSLYVRRIL